MEFDADVHESVEAIPTSDSDVVVAFYARWFEACPEAADFFGDDFRVQVAMLRVALWMANHWSPAAREYLRVPGPRHATRNVPVAMYAPLSDAGLATIREFHGEAATPELVSAWEATVRESIRARHDGDERCHHA